ncbi:predicted protein [Thalassiosira pseudonana CCMP1335]|jgi:ATP-dependent Clp protease adapter protein ClpS|uniref:Adaptor protein ClpS core domain-containing protein n=1 Tax=Thalassiosira pseudonana TaxID=35128 RepID=B5YMJ3_THAPS|nr:predicted protein [Thalassiosira pseudonana CCMP1335]ACI64818.1 predicted protein [Thalassiosira pseudonana CCMP1335]|mmetsp:Transcript_11342/g.24989  ORF Transcript_11342/g.24989 Transcript_11342/m.24989 type:complete len:177 (+) Transcript_11342:110-640(+)|eukprot:scaffold13593_cov189-Alexandrium_tamarense.AAC.16
MAPLRTIVCALLLSASAAFTTVPTPITYHRSSAAHISSPLFAKEGKGGGGGAIATPATKTVTQTTTKSKTEEVTKQKKKFKPSEPEEEYEFKEAPLWLLMLIADEADEQMHVITRLTEIVEDVNDDMAAELFKAANMVGEALVGKYPKEIGEMYAEQLTRSDPIIYAECREENPDN